MIGKKQVSQLSLFDYTVGISIGNFAAEMTINLDTDILYGLVAVFTFGVIAYCISVFTMKSISLRKFFMGTPTLIIKDGILLYDGLKKVKYDINDFLEQCREMGYFDISEIAYAVMEASGKISILPKSGYKPVTISDIKICKNKSYLVSNVIIDGHIMEDNLSFYNKNIDWIYKQLDVKGKVLDDILLATLDGDDKFLIYEKNVKNNFEVLE